MIARCERCDCRFSAYEFSDPAYKSCPACGWTRFFCTHLGFSRPTHEVLVDMETGKLESPDPCDEKP